MANRRPLIAGNWKMYKTVQEAAETASRIVQAVSGVENRDIMIAPPFIALSTVSEKLRGSRVALGAQNMHWEKEGAFTGEISASMLASAGCRHVIIGHSERRQYFGETDEFVNRKIKTAIKAGLIPVMCIGETEAERDSQKTFSVLDNQMRKGLQGFASEDVGALVFAYEPVWAIGTGKTATSKQAQEVHAFLRTLLGKMFDEAFASGIRILYGGSVKPGNIAELMSMPDVDGALVGGASLDAESFGQIVKNS
jgi:triosephosphate isomerase (TIM)